MLSPIIKIPAKGWRIQKIIPPLNFYVNSLKKSNLLDQLLNFVKIWI